MTAIGTQAAEQLIADATEVGISPQQIADAVRLRVDALEVMSGRDQEKVQRMIAAERSRQTALERLLHLVQLSGRDADKARPQVASWSTRQLTELADESEAHLRGQGIDTRTEAQKAAAREAAETQRATSRQVGYLVTLLQRRAYTGEGGGFASTSGLYAEDGTVYRAAVETLTKAGASQLIDSLTGTY